MPTKWVVHCKKVGHGLPALKYLSQYLYRGLLPDQDSTTNKITPRTLPVLKFLLLILQHVLPKGLQRVRDYGLLSSGAKKLRLII
jgi:hypothetical protein